MTLLTYHQTLGDPSNARIRIEADPWDPKNGASHEYAIHLTDDTEPYPFTTVRFQRGPILDPESCKGITNEALLAIVIDRLRGFQQGAHACRENGFALTKLEEAMHWLRERTLSRVAAGIEGRNENEPRIGVEFCEWAPCKHPEALHTRIDPHSRRTNACQLCGCSGFMMSKERLMLSDLCLCKHRRGLHVQNKGHCRDCLCESFRIAPPEHQGNR